MSDFRPGDLVAARYRLLEELGGGGMGVVFRARDEDGDRDVAIKILRQTSSEASRRLQREARAVERLDPARVAQVYDVGETPDGRPFLVMEYVEGRTLRALMREAGVDRAEALRLLREIATALAAAHLAGLVHRDVKPDNVIVRGDGRVVLLDFGIVKQLAPSDDAAHVTTQLTSEGTMIGTPAYLAPEQALGQEISPAVDQFALAVTAFELLTGRLPWTGTEVTRVLAQLLAETPPAASTVNRAIPKPFDAVLARALAKSAAARFSTIDDFVDALDAAERGIAMPSPASQTLDGPVLAAVALRVPEGASPVDTGGATVNGPASTAFPTPAAKPRRRLRTAALLGSLAALGAGALLARGRSSVGEGTKRVEAAPALTLAVSSKRPLACPILNVAGAPDVAAPLGAAAASLVCARAKWYLGGSDENVLVPAALLDAPVQPRPGLWDFYASPDARARTLEIAKSRGLPFLDGTVTRASDSWRVELVLHAAGNGGGIARSSVEATYFELAIKEAVARLWGTPPLKAVPIDSDVARWTAYPDTEAGLLELDLTQIGASAGACDRVLERGADLGRAYGSLLARCRMDKSRIDAGPIELDESSPAALVASANSLLNWGGDPFPDAEKRRIALEAEAMVGKETSRLGRASLSQLAGVLWTAVKDSNRAQASFLSAVADDPLLLYGWFQLLYVAGENGSAEIATSLASVWDPQEPEFLRYDAATQSDVLDQRIGAGELAFILEPTFARSIFLGRALAEAGRAEEVRALTVTTPVDRKVPDPDGATFLLACIDLHDAMFSRALERFEAAGLGGIKALPVLADVLGRTEKTAARWATWFLAQPDSIATTIARGTPMAMALCMNAGEPLADRCLSRVDALGSHGSKWVGGELFIAGAKRFAAGNLRGAVDAWRPVVAGPNDDLARLLPTTAFERAGEPDLAARIDARKMAYRQFAGISEATPREAKRAFARGDRAKAKELAKAVVQAWEVADTALPAVAEMRALLAKLGG